MPRSRIVTGLALGATVVVGLMAREMRDAWPSPLTAYAGDVLWPIAWWLALALVWPTARTLQLAVVVLAWTIAIEASQLYHTPWLDAIRATRVGRLLLGNTFIWSDVVCIVVGVATAVAIDLVLLRLTSPPPADAASSAPRSP